MSLPFLSPALPLPLSPLTTQFSCAPPAVSYRSFPRGFMHMPWAVCADDPFATPSAGLGAGVICMKSVLFAESVFDESQSFYASLSSDAH